MTELNPIPRATKSAGFLAGALLAIAGVIALFAGRYVGGGISLGVGLGLLLWDGL